MSKDNRPQNRDKDGLLALDTSLTSAAIIEAETLFVFPFIYLFLKIIHITPKYFLLLQSLAILTCFAFAVDHIGVEQHWWNGTQACVGPQSGAKSIADLTAQLLNTPVTRCDEPTWFFLGLSMACWNAILTFCMLLVALTRLVKKDAAPLPAG